MGYYNIHSLMSSELENTEIVPIVNKLPVMLYWHKLC